MKRLTYFIFGLLFAIFAFFAIYLIAEINFQKLFFRPSVDASQLNQTQPSSGEDGVAQRQFNYEKRADLTPKAPTSPEYSPNIFGATSFELEHKGKARTWYGYGDKTADKKAVIVLLHGAARTGLSMLDMWQNVSNAQDVILIAPNSLGPGWDEKQDGDAFLRDVINQAKREYAIDLNKIYLFGHSAGALFAQQLANSGNLTWNAVAVHAGTPHWSSYEKKLDGAAIRIYLGSKDHNFLIGQSLASAQRLSEFGHEVEFIEIPDHTHWYYIIGPALSEDAWEFFAKH